MKDRMLGTIGATAIGLVIGLALSGGGEPIRAGGSDRIDDSALAAARIATQQHPTLKTSSPQDVIYYLDYKAGRLLAAVPAYRQFGDRVTILGEFAHRDLVADFRLPAGVTPHFLMTEAELGVSSPGTALFVVETATRQIATYMAEQPFAGSTREHAPKLNLVELRPLP